MKDGKVMNAMSVIVATAPAIYFNRPLHGLTEKPGSNPSCKLLGYCHSSASRTQSHIRYLNDLLAKVLATEQPDESARRVFKSFHHGFRIFQLAFREPPG